MHYALPRWRLGRTQAWYGGTDYWRIVLSARKHGKGGQDPDGAPLRQSGQRDAYRLPDTSGCPQERWAKGAQPCDRLRESPRRVVKAGPHVPHHYRRGRTRQECRLLIEVVHSASLYLA